MHQEAIGHDPKSQYFEQQAELQLWGLRAPDMKHNICQTSDHCPEILLMSSAQDTSKPTCLKKNEIPEFRHILILSAKKKVATECAMTFQLCGPRLR
jgi:hypothetical protein